MTWFLIRVRICSCSQIIKHRIVVKKAKVACGAALSHGFLACFTVLHSFLACFGQYLTSFTTADRGFCWLISPVWFCSLPSLLCSSLRASFLVHVHPSGPSLGGWQVLFSTQWSLRFLHTLSSSVGTSSRCKGIATFPCTTVWRSLIDLLASQPLPRPLSFSFLSFSS